MNDNNTRMPWNNDILNIINIASFLLSIQNLQLNQQDLSNNHLEEHLLKQDEILHKQNEEYLTKIIEQNEKLLTILGGNKNED